MVVLISSLESVIGIPDLLIQSRGHKLFEILVHCFQQDDNFSCFSDDTVETFCLSVARMIIRVNILLPGL